MAKLCKVNLGLLPIKLHYFFFFGAMGGTVPFMPVLAKGLGINATAAGLVFTAVPFCVFLSKPFFGFLTDYFRNIKLIVIILALVTTITFTCVLFIPSISVSDNESITIDVECTDNKHLSLFPYEYNEVCLKNTLQREVHCELQYKDCNSNKTMTIIGKLREIKHQNSEAGVTNNSKCVSNVGKSRLYLPFELEDNITCSCIMKGSSFIKDSKPSIAPCFCKQAPPSSLIYNTFQFWIFTLLAVFSGTGAATVFCLSDAACYEVLGDKPEHFGRQRLWATISWGIVTLFAGFLNDLATGTSDQKDYSPGFYLMVALVLVDLFILYKIKLTKANFSLNICKDIGKIFSSCETVIFAIAVYIIGALTGLIWSYEFWFLQDLGANQTLLGLAVAVQCLVAEVPMFFFAGWFIKTFGHFYCLAGSFTAFTLRFGLYFLLENPWLVLPIEILHGLTFAIFYACMTGYASSKAPSGTEATMMGILGGLFEGLGVATGSLLGGVGFDKLGGRQTFLVAGVISLLCIPALLISRFLIRVDFCKEESCNMKINSKKRYDGEATEHKM